MSRGTRITPLRIPPDLLARIDEAIANNNAVRVDEPYQRTSWIVQAIKERLAKQERGRRSHGRRRKEPVPGGADQGQAPA